MPCCVVVSVKHGYRWRCRKVISASACRPSIPTRYGNWFQQSTQNFMEVLLLTYDNVRRVPARAIQQESISSVLQPSLSRPNSVERACCLAQHVRSVILITK